MTTPEKPTIEALKLALEQFEDMQAQVDLERIEYQTKRLEIYTPPPPPVIPDEIQEQLEQFDAEVLTPILEHEKILDETKERVRQWAPNFLSKQMPSIRGINWMVQRGATGAKFSTDNVARAMEMVERRIVYKIDEALNLGYYGQEFSSHVAIMAIIQQPFAEVIKFYSSRTDYRIEEVDWLLEVHEKLTNGYVAPTEFGKMVPIKDKK